MQPTLAQAVDMHQFIQCQIARGIHYSTQHAEYHHCSNSGVVVLLEPHAGVSVLLFYFNL